MIRSIDLAAEENLSGDEKPLCPVFGECGGCSYQDIPYETELHIKEEYVRGLFNEGFSSHNIKVDPIVASAQIYHYRNRLDLKLMMTKNSGPLVGFTPHHGKGIVEIDQCPIAMDTLSAKINWVKDQAIGRLTPKYRMANLVVKTSDDGRVFWGGMGRRSLTMKEEDYFWTKIRGKKIYYSLDTFFQANLSILPKIVERIRQLGFFKSRPFFYDLYGGVGLFGISVSDLAAKVVIVEECQASVKIADYNIVQNRLKNVMAIHARLEDYDLAAIAGDDKNESVVMVDPPRAGLSAPVAKRLAGLTWVNDLVYLSCNPQSLVNDLKIFLADGWSVRAIEPFDFFPRTKHIEVLAVLGR